MILFTVKVVGMKLLLFDVHGNLNVKSTGKCSAPNHNIILYRVLIECVTFGSSCTCSHYCIIFLLNLLAKYSLKIEA